jgi:hypothetical protein
MGCVSNTITADHDPAASDLVMSNGLTSVFSSVLLLNGSDLARAHWEVATVAWLAERDQSTVGLGVVGFDVSNLGWTPVRYAEQKQFLLRTVDAAMARRRWEVLSYEPNAELLLPCLAAFRDLVSDRGLPQGTLRLDLVFGRTAVRRGEVPSARRLPHRPDD